MTDRMIALADGALSATIAPSLGGAIVAAQRADWAFLQAAPELAPDRADPAAVVGMASFPLVPYANRIDRGRFVAGGRDIRLAPTLAAADPVHPLHGHGWLAPWLVTDQAAAQVTLELRHDGKAPGVWPWPFVATQRIALADGALEQRLTLHNPGDAPMPAGLGLHPRFPGGARVSASASGRWDGAPGGIPTHWRAGASIAADMAALGADDVLDHCYGGRRGPGRLDWTGHSLTIDASDDLGWLHLYQPAHRRWLCIEPVSHRPDAHNGLPDEASGLRWLAPGETWGVWARFTPA